MPPAKQKTEGLPVDEGGTEPPEPEYTEHGAPVTEGGKYYCPGCGRRYRAEGECYGLTAETPHPPIRVVSTRELDKSGEHHTVTPDTVF